MAQLVLDPCFGRPVQGFGAFSPGDLIDRITLETAYGPTMVFDTPFDASPPNPIWTRMKPRITITIKGVAQPIVSEPYGAPPPTAWPQVVAAGSVLGGILVVLAGIGAYHLARRGS